VVTTCHGFFKRRLSRRLFDYWGDRTIAISRPVMKSLMDDFTVEGGRIALVHSGVDTEKFSRRYSDKEVSDLRRQSGLPPDRPVIGAIGRLSPVKGHPVFIEAVRRVSGSGRSVQGLLVGSGPEEGALRRLVKEKGMEDSFRFLKSDPDTARYLAMMDIFVFPSFREGLGLGLLEAMAAGRPCVASNVGGISDIVMDGETGLLFPAGDAAALSSLILRLLDDRGLCERLGASAGVFVRNNFSVGTMADRILNIYKEVRQSVCA
jgi:glycosyltransferase involved in cell wall biosynthesis